MQYPSEMGDDARYLREMIERTADAVDRLDRKSDEWWMRIDRILRGSNGTPGIEEQVRRNTEKLEELRGEGMKFWLKVTGVFTAITLIMEVVSKLLGGN